MKKKDLIQLYITGVLIVVLAFLVVRAMGGKKHSSPLKGSIKQKSTTPKEGKREGLFAELDEVTKDLEIGIDPFYREVEEPVRGPHLTGIYWDEENPKAIINGEIVGVGSVIEGDTIVDILKDTVILRSGDNIFKLRIGQE